MIPFASVFLMRVISFDKACRFHSGSTATGLWLKPFSVQSQLGYTRRTGSLEAATTAIVFICPHRIGCNDCLPPGFQRPSRQPRRIISVGESETLTRVLTISDKNSAIVFRSMSPEAEARVWRGRNWHDAGYARRW